MSENVHSKLVSLRKSHLEIQGPSDPIKQLYWKFYNWELHDFSDVLDSNCIDN